MKYFKVSEFDDISKMSPRLLCALDDFRDVLGLPVYLSPVKGAQWRNDNSNSQHNINHSRRQSRAIDIFPKGDPWHCFMAALSIPNIKGIGLYPHWEYPSKHLTFGMHLDVRETPCRVIWWENIDKEYITIHSFNAVKEFIGELH